MNAWSDVDGSMRTPLHHAAAAGDLVVLRTLVEHGADLAALDPGFNATPLGRADFFESQMPLTTYEASPRSDVGSLRRRFAATYLHVHLRT